MRETQGIQEAPATATAKVALIGAVCEVWQQGHIAPDEALRQMYSIFQGAFITPSGTRLREAYDSYRNEQATPYPMFNHGTLSASSIEGGTTTISGPNRLP